MEITKTIYFVTGLAAVGKTSAILPAILEQKEKTGSLFLISTDALRPPALPGEHDKYAWENTLYLINFHLERFIASNIFIEGVAFQSPEHIEKILEIEKNNPSLKIKLAWVGSTKTAKRIEKPNWHDGSLYYPVTEDAVRISLELESYIKSLDKLNYKFFDLMEVVSPKERLAKEPVELKESDIKDNAKEVVKFLLDS
jgi:hypothetical protein